MARMYEMNLIIRLQDRASARMRRISGDMSALSRHAQAQNRLMQLQGQTQKAQIKQGTALSNLHSLEDKHGLKQLANLQAQSRLNAQILRQQDTMEKRVVRRVRGRTGKMTTQVVHRRIPQASMDKFAAMDDDVQRQRWLKRNKYNAVERAMMYDYLALQTKQLALDEGINRQKTIQNGLAKEAIAEQKALNAEIAQRTVLEARGNRAALNYRRGRAAAHAGSLAFMGGAVTTGLAGLAAASYANFDVATTKAATQIGSTDFINNQLGVQAAVKQTQASAQELEKVILGMAKEFPATAQEMSAASYNIFSSMDLGNTVQERMTNGMRVLREANKAAVGGQVDLATATDTLITVFNDFDPRLGSLHKNMAELFAIVRFMRGGFEELNAGMNKLAPAARQAGQNLLEVGAAFAIITQAIPSAAQASTAEARLLQMFGTEYFIEGMKKMKQEVTYTAKNGTQQLIPMFKIMDKILKVEPSLAAGGPATQTFMKRITDRGSPTGKGGSQGTIFQQRAFSVLVTEHPKHRDILNQMRKDVVEYDKSVQALSEASGVKWKIAMNQLKVAWIQFGQTAMPILLAVLDKFTVLLDKFNNISAGNRKIIGSLIVISGLVLTVGGLFTSAFGGVAMVVATQQLWKIEKALIAVETGQQAVARSTLLMRLGYIGIAIAAAAAAYMVYKHWQRVKHWFAAFTQSIPQMFKSAWKIAIGEMKIQAGEFLLMLSGLLGILDAIKIKGVHLFPSFGAGTVKKYALDLIGGGVGNIADAARDYAKVFGDNLSKYKPSYDKNLTKEQNDALNANIQKGEQAAASEVKYSQSKLDYITKINAAAKDQANKLIAYEKKVQKARTEAAQAGKTATESMLKTMEAFMVAKEQEFRSTNKQGMDLFGGPMTGITGIFSDINTQLASYGIKPIPVPVKLILDAQDFQVSQFEDWRAGLDTLKKKLGPGYNKMVLELQSQGVASNPLVQSMLKATPAELKRWKTNWDKMQADIEAATQADIQTLKDLWATYPKDVVARIMTGLQSEEGTLSNGYRQYLVGTYPAQIAAEYGKAYNESLSNWFASNPPPKPDVIPPPPKAPASSGGGAASRFNNPNYRQQGEALVSAADVQRMNVFAKTSGIPNTQTAQAAVPYKNPVFIKPSQVPKGGITARSDNWTWWWNNRTWIPILASKPDAIDIKAHRKPANAYPAPIKKATGGIIGGSGSGDTVPAMLTPGEVVLNKRHIKNAAQMLGTANHPQAVFNKVQKFDLGGVVKGVFGKKGLYGAGKDLAYAFSNEGLKKQAAGMYGSVRHPLRRLNSGGQMAYPGGKPNVRLGADTLAASKAIQASTNDLILNYSKGSVKEARDANVVLLGAFYRAVKLPSARLNALLQAKGLKDYKIEVGFGEHNYDSLMNSTLSKSTRKELGLSSYTPDFYVTIKGAKGGETPGFSVFTDSRTGKFRVDDVIDLGDKDFLPTKKVETNYFKAIDAVRNTKKSGYLTLHRSMLPEEFFKWREGASIPTGKFFSATRGGASGMDVSGVFPDLFSFRVKASDVVETSPGVYQLMNQSFLKGKKIQSVQHKAKGGWVTGTGNRDNVPAFLTPGEYVVSKPMIRDLTSRKANAAAPVTHVTHEQNINVDVTNPTGKAILDALKPVLFALRHQP